MSEQVPEGWRWVELGDVCDVVMGQSPPSSTYRTYSAGLPFFQGKAEFGPLHPVPRVWCVEPKKIALPGDVLISVRAPVGPTNLADTECCIGRGLAAIRPKSKVNHVYLLHVLRAKEEAIAADGTGSTFKSISGKRLRAVQIPLPPLDEQRRIVDQLETQLAAAECAREAAQAQLDALDAIPGALLQRIFPRSPAAKLLRGWRWVKLGDVCREDRVAISSDDSLYQSLPYLGLEHVEPVTGRILVTEETALASGTTSNNFRFSPEHVLYGKLRPYLSKVALPHYSGRCTTELIPLRPMGTDREWLAWILRRQETVDYAMAGKTGSRMPRTSMSSLMDMDVPLAPRYEQRRLVDQLQRQLAAGAHARQAAQAQLDASNALPTALLRLAFAA